MTPAEHAAHGALAFGGSADGHLPVHAFMDQLAASVHGPRHQLFLHSADFGPALATLCVPAVPVGRGRVAHMGELVEQHLEGDFGWQPRLEDWLDALDLEQLPLHGMNEGAPEIVNDIAAFRMDPLGTAAARWGGCPNDYRCLLAFLDAPSRITDHPAASWVLHNSWGPAIAEAALGPTLRLAGGATVQTREVAGAFVRAFSGTFLEAAAVANALVVRPWMTAVSKRPVPAAVARQAPR